MDNIIMVLLIAVFSTGVVYMSPVISQSSAEIIAENNDKTSLFDSKKFETTDSFEYPSGLVEEIKSRILKNLHKTEAPRTHVSLPPLKTLNSRHEILERQMNVSTEENTETDFIPADVDSSSCIDDNSFLCIGIHFNIPKQNRVGGVELWVYKKRNISSFTVTHTIRGNNQELIEKSITVFNNQTLEKGWLRFDVSHMVSSDNISVLDFKISSEGEDFCVEFEDDKKPFLLIHTISTNKSISKRSSSYCENGSTTCCRKKFYIKFKDVNWGEWIVHPEGYEANYCAGTCSSNIGLSNSHHARVFLALCENNPQKFRETGKTECLTCAPSAYRSISVIYMDETDVQVVSHLPGMSVTDCGCV